MKYLSLFMLLVSSMQICYSQPKHLKKDSATSEARLNFTVTENNDMLTDGFETFVGRLIYDGKLYGGQFLVKENIIMYRFKEIYLTDKKLERFTLQDKNGIVYTFDKKDKTEHGRLLFDAMGMQAYDRLVYFPSALPNRYTLEIAYNGKWIKYIDSDFRNDSGDEISFLNRCHVDGQRKEFLKNWMALNFTKSSLEN